MKIKKIAVPESALVVEGFTEYRPVFESKEAMVAYYMQMNEFVNYGLQAPLAQELPYMVGLIRKLKQFLLLIQQLDECRWGEGVVEIQKACAAYAMNESINVDKRMKVNESVGKHIAFLMDMAAHRGILKQLHGIAAAHYKNVMELIEERVAQEAASEAEEEQPEG
ncbi:hypothetical protein [Bacteroides sp.]